MGHEVIHFSTVIPLPVLCLYSMLLQLRSAAFLKLLTDYSLDTVVMLRIGLPYHAMLSEKRQWTEKTAIRYFPCHPSTQGPLNMLPLTYTEPRNLGHHDSVYALNIWPRLGFHAAVLATSKASQQSTCVMLYYLRHSPVQFLSIKSPSFPTCGPEFSSFTLSCHHSLPIITFHIHNHLLSGLLSFKTFVYFIFFH